jgi:hypothetical protein
MLLLSVDFGQVYLKCSIMANKSLINDSISTYDSSSFTNLKLKLTTDITIKEESYSIIFFIVSVKTHVEFMNSIEYKIISNIINIDKPIKVKYSGYPSLLDIDVLSNMFPNSDLVHYPSRSTILSIIGFDYIHNEKNHKLFKLPEVSLRKLTTVGKVNKLSEKDRIYIDKDNDNDFYPYILANIVEGSSIYKVTSKNSYERLGGSSFGATTYWSLVQLCCKYDDPIKAVIDGLDGDNSKIDLSVEDIFGGSYENFNLPDDLIASSFGKIKRYNDLSQIENKDISKSLMILFSLCNGQIMSLLAKQEKIKKVIIFGNPFPAYELMQLFQTTVTFMTNSEVETYFSDYSTYLTLIGLNYKQINN